MEQNKEESVLIKIHVHTVRAAIKITTAMAQMKSARNTLLPPVSSSPDSGTYWFRF